MSPSAAARRITQILSLRPLAHRIARYYPPPHDDRFQDGMVGVTKAVDAYDPTHRTALTTYAAVRIRGEILDGIRREDHLSRKYRDEETARRAAGGGDDPRQQKPVSFQVVRDEDSPYERGGTLDPGYAGVEARMVVTAALKTLTEQERQVIVGYYYDGRTGKDIAAGLKVTESRVSQIRKTAEGRMRQRMGKAAMSSPPGLPPTGTICAVHHHRTAVPYAIHHVWPVELGGPNAADNRVLICSNGHAEVHDYLALLGKGPVPWVTRLRFHHRVRALAVEGFNEYLLTEG